MSVVDDTLGPELLPQLGRVSLVRGWSSAAYNQIGRRVSALTLASSIS